MSSLKVNFSTSQVNNKVNAVKEYEFLELKDSIYIPNTASSLSYMPSFQIVENYLYVKSHTTAYFSRVNKYTGVIEYSDFIPRYSNKGVSIVSDDSYIYFLDSDYVYKIDKVSFKEVSRVPADFYGGFKLFLIGDYLYAAGSMYYNVYETYIYRINKNTMIADASPFYTIDSGSMNFTTDGTYFYVVSYHKLTKIRVSDGTVITEVEQLNLSTSYEYGHSLSYFERTNISYIIAVPTYGEKTIIIFDAEDLRVVHKFDFPYSFSGDLNNDFIEIGNELFFVDSSSSTMVIFNPMKLTLEVYDMSHAYCGRWCIDPTDKLLIILPLPIDFSPLVKLDRYHLDTFSKDIGSKLILKDTTRTYERSTYTKYGDRVISAITVNTTINTVLNNPDDFIFTTPAYIDALTSYDGVGPGVTILIYKEGGDSLYSSDGTHSTIFELSNAGIIDYTDIKDPVTFRLKDALEYDSSQGYGLFYGYLSTIPKTDWDKELKIYVSYSTGSNFTTLTEAEAIDLFRNATSLNFESYAYISNPLYDSNNDFAVGVNFYTKREME